MTDCANKKCLKPAIYWVMRPRVVNRYFCGYHTIKYWRANKGEALKQKIIGTKSKLPYGIWALESEWKKFTRAEKDRLDKYGSGTNSVVRFFYTRRSWTQQSRLVRR